MNARTLGTIGIVGGLVGMAEGLRQVMLGTQLAPGLRDLDTITSAAYVIAAVGGICALMGFLALRGTGTKPIFRLLTYLPAVSYIAAVIMGLATAVGVLTSDAESPIAMLVVFLADLFHPAAWVVVAILTIAAREWHGWRRFVPAAIVAAFPLGIVISTATGLVGMFLLFHYAGTVLLGYAVRSAAPVAQPVETLAQAAYR